MRPDILLLVPLESVAIGVADPTVRQTYGAHLGGPLLRAVAELEDYLGISLDFSRPDSPLFGERRLLFPVQRSLTAVTLATHLERAGLAWEVVDPGVRELDFWRRRLLRARSNPPRAVGITTTYIMGAPFIEALCRLVRRILPESKLLIGGYYYAADSRRFLSLDADVLCVGEGEVRLPQIVEAIREGKPLEEIPGLYLRRPDGSLHYTGNLAQLNLASLPPVDWKLSSRIEPAISPEKDEADTFVETQRGCVFKCEFCIYRTLAGPALLQPEQAVDVLINAGTFRRGYINLVDPTATFPNERWDEMLRLLIQRGGSSAPIWAFVRISDLSDERVELMARAGVRIVFIGLETGDQRLMDLMRKGTRVEQVEPAVRALKRHGIPATFGLMHGFPGETAESLQATRTLLANINSADPERPAVFNYHLGAFALFDFASISQRDGLTEARHFLDYGAMPFSPERACDEILQTVIATARIPHAPTALVPVMLSPIPLSTGLALATHPHVYEIFRWFKDIDRAIGIFLERDLEGRRDGAELSVLRSSILSRYPRPGILRSTSVRYSAKVRARLLTRLSREWGVEKEAGPGPATRLLLGGLAFQSSGEFAEAWRTWSTGIFPAGSRMNQGSSGTEITSMAGEMAKRAIEEEKHARLPRAG